MEAAETFSDDGTITEDSACNVSGRLLCEAFAKLGKPILPMSEYERLLRDGGFVNINSRILKRPTNDWPKDPRMKEVGRVCHIHSTANPL